jgi:hypothetical protein
MGLIPTKRTFLPALDGSRSEETIEVPQAPNRDQLRALVEPLLDGQRLEHVAVLWDDKRCSMFVGETSTIDGLPFNAEATKVYRNNWMTRHPDADPDELPEIRGPAVLFDRNVWF